MNQSLTIESTARTTSELRPTPQKVQLCYIAHAAQDCIRSSKYAGVRLVDCDVHVDRLRLRGRVSSFYLKQIAQEAVRSLNGIEAIVNDIDVVYQDSY